MLIAALKFNTPLLNEDVENKFLYYFERKLNIHNVVTLYKISVLFMLQSLVDKTLRFIERCFTIVSETESFLELSFHDMKKILSSNELHISSELQIFDAADC